MFSLCKYEVLHLWNATQLDLAGGGSRYISSTLQSTVLEVIASVAE